MKAIRTACAIAVLLIAARPTRSDTVGFESLPPPARTTDVRSNDGVRFRAYEWGNPNGTAIVFVHGIYQSALSWSRQLGDPLLASKYRLIAIDLRGHGASDKPDGEQYYREGKRWADDISALLDTLHLAKPVMVAWSYGGRVINDYLSVNGDGRFGGIVYVAVRSLADAGARTYANPAIQDAVSPDPVTFLKGTREFVELCFGVRPSDAEIDWLTAASMQTPLYVRRELSGRPLAYSEVLRSIRVPTLIVQGDGDAVVPLTVALMTHRLIPQSKLSVYHGAGHSTFREETARFDAELDHFVSSLATERESPPPSADHAASAASRAQ